MVQTGEGLVLGRFQPLHPGHLWLIDRAMTECAQTVICIGSAQQAEPYTIEQRHTRMQAQLEVLHPDKDWRIVDLVDPEPMNNWPEYVKEQCELKGEPLRFYRAEQDGMTPEHEAKLRNIGFTIIYVQRQPFYYQFPDGLYRKVSSATEIRRIL
jgi:cytidyltransferase-like protein